MTSSSRLRTTAALLAALVFTSIACAQAPAPPSDLEASDHPFDGGHEVDLTWKLSPDDDSISGYKIYRSLLPPEIEKVDKEGRAKAIAMARTGATLPVLESLGLSGTQVQQLSEADKAALRQKREAEGVAAGAAYDAEVAAMTGTRWAFVTAAKPGETSTAIDKLKRGVDYTFRIEAFRVDGWNGADSVAGTSTSAVSEAVAPMLQWFSGARLWLAIITLALCGAIVYWILHARQGKPIKVRKIAGLDAVDEAVGRATEMGRSCLFVPGIQDMNDIQTIAGITILARVAKTAAEYDAKVEVPTSRSLVMTTARETVQASFLAAGRPDAFNEDLIYYVTDEQFGYVAYLSGMMVREKPAACFYMGSFFAESLILAETGNSIGAIQVAGTAQPAQLPFFVAACDYTLIGEEFFAASAYLSGSAEELGSLKGQDVGKLIVALLMVVGITAATLGFTDIVDFIKNVMLT